MTDDERVMKLVRWKMEAMDVLNEWDKVAAIVELFEPCPLGESKAKHAQKVLTDLL